MKRERGQEGGIYFGSQFKDTVHHGVEKALALLGNWQHCSQSLESGSRWDE